jgi:hypothetical protein
MKFALLVLLLAVASPIYSQTRKQPDSGPARRQVLFRQHGTIAWSCPSSNQSAFIYVAGFAVDADGAPRAYHPNNQRGLDSIDHAGHPGNWWALATDTGETNGRPLIQRKGDPAPGYYISMTALYDSANPNERDPRRYVDAAKIPYVVLPPVGLKHAKLGDFATVMNLRNRKIAEAIVADESAPDLKMGEGSIALANQLGIDSNPRYGGIDRGVAYVIYPGSGNGNPRLLKEIIANSQDRFQAWGGLEKLNVCLGEKRR